MQRLNGGRKIDKRRRIGEVKSCDLTKTVETMIRLNEGQPKKANAVVKWKKDLKYVLDYKVEKQRKIYGAIRRRM